MKLPCPTCGAATEVIETRLWKDESIIRRRRKCKKCNHTFPTVELPLAIARKILRVENLPKGYKTQTVG